MKKGFLVRIKKSNFEGNNYVGNFSHIVNSYFGFNSYCGSRCSLVNTKVGRYTSIASKVEVVFGKHPTSKWVSTHPSFYSTSAPTGLSYTKENRFEENSYAIPGYFVNVGNDVWIGHDVKLMEGITIGDGAIIATGAVVSSDVPPYSIVGGIPSKIIKRRFSEEEIQFLLNLRWWEKDSVWIKEHANLFDDVAKMRDELMGNVLND